MVKKIIALLSSVLWVLLPKCSLCLYAYMSIFSALGLGNLLLNKNTLFFMSIFLVVNFVTVLFMLFREKEFLYAIISFVAALVFICNKFFLHNNIYVNILVSSILILAIIRIRLLNVLSKQCIFYGRLGNI